MNPCPPHEWIDYPALGKGYAILDVPARVVQACRYCRLWRSRDVGTKAWREWVGTPATWREIERVLRRTA